MRYSSTVIGLALCLSACASGGTGGTRLSRDVLTQAQLAETGHLNAYDAIRSLQPRWLRPGMSIYHGEIGAQGLGGCSDIRLRKPYTNHPAPPRTAINNSHPSTFTSSVVSNAGHRNRYWIRVLPRAVIQCQPV